MPNKLIGLGVMVMWMALLPSAQAVDLRFTFESYSDGALNGQDGWVVTGDTTGYPPFVFTDNATWDPTPPITGLPEGVKAMGMYGPGTYAATHSLAGQAFTDNGTTFSYYSQLNGVSGGVMAINLIATDGNDYVQINYTGNGAIRVFHGAGWTDLSGSPDGKCWTPGWYKTTITFDFTAGTFDVSVQDLTWPSQIINPGTFTFLSPVGSPVTKETAGGSLMLRGAPLSATQGLVVDDLKFVPNIVQGTVSLGDYPGDRKKVGVWIELRQGATVVREEGKILDSSGQFTLLNVPMGTYDVAIKSYAHLQKVAPGVNVSTGPTIIAPVTLINGDLDGNNGVTGTDLSIVLNNLDIPGE